MPKWSNSRPGCTLKPPIAVRSRRWAESGMASPLKPRRRRGRIASALLAVDAWLDSSLYEIGFKAREFWEAATIFSRRFRVNGWRRGIIELLSEGFTMGAGGIVVLLALALPAFQI